MDGYMAVWMEMTTPMAIPAVGSFLNKARVKVGAVRESREGVSPRRTLTPLSSSQLNRPGSIGLMDMTGRFSTNCLPPSFPAHQLSEAENGPANHGTLRAGPGYPGICPAHTSLCCDLHLPQGL